MAKLYTGRPLLNFERHDKDVLISMSKCIMNGSRELPMPNVTHIFSLNQGHATLLLCWTKLSKFTQEQTPTGSYAWSPVSVSKEKQHFQRWLDQWELAFSSYLSNAIASMNDRDVMQSRILKTNHLACTVLASDTPSSPFDFHETEFRAIIELSTAVLRARQSSEEPRTIKPDQNAIPVESNLDIRHPLLVVVSQCRHEDLKARANDLLSTFSD